MQREKQEERVTSWVSRSGSQVQVHRFPQKQGGAAKKWRNRSRNFDRCVFVCVREREESRMRRAVLSSLSVEMKTEGEEEEGRHTYRMKKSMGEQANGGDRFVCISLEEMESFYRYSQCCHQLHSESCVMDGYMWRV